MGCAYHPDKPIFKGSYCVSCYMAFEAGQSAGIEQNDEAGTGLRRPQTQSASAVPDDDGSYRDRTPPELGFTSCMYHPDQSVVRSGLCGRCLLSMEASGPSPPAPEKTSATEFPQALRYTEPQQKLLNGCPYLEQLNVNELDGVVMRLTDNEAAALGAVLTTLETHGQWALGIAEVEKDGQERHKIGTEAHLWFRHLNEELAKTFDRVGSNPEYFGIEGIEVRRYTLGSKSVDLMLTLRGEPVLGVDLKSGRTWTKRDRQKVVNAVGCPVIQIGPFV